MKDFEDFLVNADIPLNVDAAHILNKILGRHKEFLILLLQKHIFNRYFLVLHIKIHSIF